jgi:hydrogenase nickel incorporation protein HypA/HybF
MIDKSALLFSFDVMAKGTIAENAMLKFIDIAGRACCETCQTNIRVHRYDQACENCGSFLYNIQAGEELRVKSMEVE